MPPAPSCRISEDQDHGTASTVGADNGGISFTALPAPQSHNVQERDAAVNRQVRLLSQHALSICQLVNALLR